MYGNFTNGLVDQIWLQKLEITRTRDVRENSREVFVLVLIVKQPHICYLCSGSICKKTKTVENISPLSIGCAGPLQVERSIAHRCDGLIITNRCDRQIETEVGQVHLDLTRILTAQHRPSKASAKISNGLFTWQDVLFHLDHSFTWDRRPECPNLQTRKKFWESSCLHVNRECCFQWKQWCLKVALSTKATATEQHVLI